MDDRTAWTPGEQPEPEQPAAPSWSTPGPVPPPAVRYGGPSYEQPAFGATPQGAMGYPPPSPTMPGYPPPPAQPFGSAPYPGAPQPMAGYGHPLPGTDGLAVAALVVGIVGVLVPLVGQILAIVLGAVALGRIKRSGRQGRGMAIAGIWLGAAWIVVGVASAIAIPVFLNQRHEALHDACANGDMAACDTLYDSSAEGSDEQQFGDTCGGRTDGGYLCTAIGDVTYGDDERLDSLWDACAAGDPSSCDELSWSAEPGSDYAEYGLTCGGRTDGSVDCVDAMDTSSETT